MYNKVNLIKIFGILIIFLILLFIVIYIFIRQNQISKYTKKNLKFIPKIIHQTFSSKNMPKKIKQNIEHLKKMNPDWKYKFYTDEDIIKYIKINFPNLLKFYLQINKKYGAAKADFFRYLVLYKEGGIYLDLKSSAIFPLTNVIKYNDEFILSHWTNGWGKHPEIKNSNNKEYMQWFIISRPRHPYLKKTIDNIVKNIKKYDYRRDNVGKKGVLKLTGPIVYTNSIIEVMDRNKHRFVSDVEKELGLVYKIVKGKFYKNHYSLLNDPIVIP